MFLFNSNLGNSLVPLIWYVLHSNIVEFTIHLMSINFTNFPHLYYKPITELIMVQFQYLEFSVVAFGIILS